MELYLNVAQMGDGIYGIEAASRAYFGKSASKLTRAEAAQIASCLPNPVRYPVKPMSKYVARRYPWVMRQMNNLEGDPDVQGILGTSK
jgi:monofunctional biosynthetic peptidoglycan transglycosylase